MASHLNKARDIKNDEFYTLLEDIEKEIPNYIPQLVGKKIILPCDNPDYPSSFWTYFHDNFHKLGIKEVTATHISEDNHIFATTYDGKVITKKLINCNGSFESKEIIDLMKQNDIVITNPPFSKLKSFLKILLENDKKFLFIGPQTFFTATIAIKSLIEERMKAGYNKINYFIRPDGTKQVFGNVAWFTNLNVATKPKLILTEEYEESKYPKIDNDDVIFVKSLKEIPKNYDGWIGVPITYALKHNKDQFEIRKTKPIVNPEIDGKKYFIRIIVKRK